MTQDTFPKFRNIKIDSRLAFSNIPRGLTNSLTHAYHRYPAKFIPNLASFLIERNTKKGDLICDPFGGCGTTLVEAKIAGRDSIGIDINPLASLISRTKITPINPNKLNKQTEIFLEGLSVVEEVVQVKHQEKLEKWFTPTNLSKLDLIYQKIAVIKDPYIKRFFLCAFSHILKNSSKWLTKSIKPQIDPNKVEQNPISIFARHLRFMSDKNETFFNKLLSKNNFKVKASFYIRDARKTGLPTNSIDYIVTSPPYVTSYEYAELHHLSLIWFNLAEDWIDFKKRFIGTKHRSAKNKPLNSPIAYSIVDQLEYNSPALAKKVRTYYEDMLDFIGEFKRILKQKKKNQ